MERIRLGGHRGSGCTDSAFARAASPRSRARGSKPPENTLESIAQAFEHGADFVEIDVLRTLDDALVVTHSNALREHVLVAPPSARFMGELRLEEVRQLRTGLRGRQSAIPTLTEVMDLIAEWRARRGLGDFVLNIEIKDVKGTRAPKQAPGRPSLVELLAKQVPAHSRLSLEAIVFSSFAVSDLVELARLLPAARLGMLFDLDREAGGLVYEADPQLSDRYLPFTPAEIENVRKQIAEVGGRLEFLHPEIDTLTSAAMKAASPLGVNCWVMRERVPVRRRHSLRQALRLARTHQLRLGVITDFVPETRQQLAGLRRNSRR
ncbi:glycerophosphodiester phosphodiesterase [Hyalangium minutum]|uniref:Glycerophosphoryl diester phosphodiesterase n=1 Tax=Hyalangium minutum TaxID=394096 RepID=A0A085W5V5_9BACT|nr:glycerophosphodiester phosphodiesterase [Hyalangium minutum]KFE63068.1 glycerophosphoryl diester phosphodiesterase [Hyalangium minutum]